MVRILSILMAGAALAGAANGSDEWQNATLEGGITMDVPAAVHRYRTDDEHVKKGQFAFFSVQIQDFDDLTCTLGRNAYSASFTREMTAAALADKGSREALCSGLDGWSNVQIGESDTRSVSGYAAGHCASAYTVANDKMAGHVTSVLGIAAPDGFYQFSCTLDSPDQAEATAHWTAIWSPDVKHMEDSIRLGK